MLFLAKNLLKIPIYVPRVPLTAESVGKVLALPKNNSLGNKVVLALPYTNTFVAVLQHYNTPILL